jgi:NTP pyrophosphatase (non-canonical NTP hydrolase)
MLTIRDMQNEAWANSETHGFHEGDENKNIPTKLMLIVSELAEALEEFRDNTPFRYLKSDKRGLPKPEGIGPELADVVIRVGDLAGLLGIDLEDLVIEKMEYNRGRQYRHGGRRV